MLIYFCEECETFVEGKSIQAKDDAAVSFMACSICDKAIFCYKLIPLNIRLQRVE
jgi:hypothetical protein